MSNIIQFTYTDSKNNTTDRTAIVVSPAKNLVTAFDVTSLDADTISKMQHDLSQYQEYRERHMKALFSFEDWLSHTNAETDPSVLKHRSFKPSKMDIK